jgi:hypothetical protein
MLLADLSGASVSNSYGPSPVLASLGGRTILELPSSNSLNLDGKLFKLIIAGSITDDAGINTNAQLFLKVNGGGFSSFGSGSTHNSAVSGSGAFFVEHDCLWESSSQTLNIVVVKDSDTGGDLSISGASGLATSISSQAIQFSFGAYWNNTSNPVSITLKQFTLSGV